MCIRYRDPTPSSKQPVMWNAASSAGRQAASSSFKWKALQALLTGDWESSWQNSNSFASILCFWNTCIILERCCFLSLSQPHQLCLKKERLKMYLKHAQSFNKYSNLRANNVRNLGRNFQGTVCLEQRSHEKHLKSQLYSVRWSKPSINTFYQLTF